MGRYQLIVRIQETMLFINILVCSKWPNHECNGYCKIAENHKKKQFSNNSIAVSRQLFSHLLPIGAASSFKKQKVLNLLYWMRVLPYRPNHLFYKVLKTVFSII